MGEITIRELDPVLRELARTNCNENPDTVVEQIEVIQEWIRKSPHLKASNNPQLILAFLRRCKFSLEETKKRIDNYYAMKNEYHDVLCERELSDELIEFYRTGIHVIPNKPIANDGPAVMISQYCKIDSKKSNPRLAFKLLFILFETLAMESDNASIVGLTYIIDCRDVGLHLMTQFEPFLLKRGYIVAENCMPLKLKEVHVINMRREGVSVFNFISSFMPNTMRFKFVAHKKAEDLLECIPRDAVTVEYGGNNGYLTEAIKSFETKLLLYREHFKNDGNFGTNEKLRIGRKREWELVELSGAIGSFRKLEVD
ncbi:alpha-tocopherol transfer protein-like [Bactrocera neohumeralis]|uniref:alpha-tocopherol transfer protein-like n=1 Tax=Bactrocera neohumeralis TaxID=98809 RepID=UPI0021666CCE|nr:alpha-tocopherol transfer protein-like [Bactrocera neohumeralis]